ncbi:pentapeptide repeat-containing protein [Nostoc sp. PA-18-2419]|uniref:pentapeptide repeat-containing protein n=1 Tax=Nostoc sp. PA-18-2419 TaxID=2575443 RepID=UPI001109E58A|nr:pentapeptide repeat-containing protein [Nostoc sp. PA-18-2419]
MSLDFSSQNLRGRSFRGQNLASANFSYADIRGTDFTNANLRGANFRYAQAGLQKRWVTLLVIISWFLSVFSGFLSAFVSSFITALVLDKTSSLMSLILGLNSIVLIITFFFITIRQGIQKALESIIFVGAIAIVEVFVGAIIGTGVFSEAFTFAGAYAGAFAGVGVIAVVLSITFAFAGAYAKVFAGVGTIAVVLYVVLSVVLSKNFVEGLAIVIALLSIYISWRSLEGDEKYAIIRSIAIAFAAFGGTSFRGADLTDADLTQATLKNTDFRNAILIRTRFYQTKMLDRVRPGLSYLQKAQVREVLVTGHGEDRIFDHQDLRGINLQETRLVDTSFLGANLNEANLQNTDLSRAKLVQTQLDGTDFTGANLTGACIENWVITSNTRFDDVKCQYVYMRLPTKENLDPLRKPDNRQEVFADGEFGNFIKPIFNTLDLYHSQGVDPRAIAISFKQLAEDNPDAELEIVALEKRGRDNFLLRAKTVPNANKSVLSAEYFEIYNQLKALAEQELETLIVEKDSRTRSLETMVVTVLQRHKFYTETHNYQQNTVSQSPKQVSHNYLQNSQFGGGIVNTDTLGFPLSEVRVNTNDILLQNALDIYNNLSEIRKEKFIPLDEYLEVSIKKGLVTSSNQMHTLFNRIATDYPGAIRIESIRGKTGQYIAFFEEYLQNTLDS